MLDHLTNENLSDEYVIVITDRERIGTIKNADVYRVKSVSVESITRNNMTPNQAKSEKLYLQKLEDHFAANNMYFSYGYDLTQSLQRQTSTSPDPSWKQVMDLTGFNVELSHPAVLMDFER
jgi:hypothetical protein